MKTKIGEKQIKIISKYLIKYSILNLDIPSSMFHMRVLSRANIAPKQASLIDKHIFSKPIGSDLAINIKYKLIR